MNDIMCEETNKLINIVKRQTDYTEEVIIEKLRQHKNKVEDIILEYNGVSTNQRQDKITTNQKIFKAIRDNMNRINEENELRKSKK